MGVKESSKVNNIITAVNLLVVSFIIVFGSINSKPHNWELKTSEVKTELINNEISDLNS